MEVLLRRHNGLNRWPLLIQSLPLSPPWRSTKRVLLKTPIMLWSLCQADPVLKLYPQESTRVTLLA